MQKWLESIISKKVFTLSILVALVTSYSLSSLNKISIEVMPKENTPSFLYIRLDAKEQLDPESVAKTLSLPAEGILKTVPRLLKMNSQTDARGVSFSLTFKPKTNLDLTSQIITENIQGIETQGLISTRSLAITRLNPDASSVLKISFASNEELLDKQKQINDQLKQKLESISGVSKIEFSNTTEPTVIFKTTKKILAERGISPSDFSAKLNFAPIRENLGLIAEGKEATKKNVLFLSESKTLSDVRKKNVGTRSVVTLSSLTDEVRKNNIESTNRTNGAPAFFIEIFAKETANLFDLRRDILQKLRALKESNSLFKTLQFENVLDKISDLELAISDVFENLWQAILTTFLVVFLFIRKLRQTMLICVTIPMSLIYTVLIMYLNNSSLNILTLSGLILGIGMVVDNAILVVQKLGDFRDLPAREAAAKAASQSSLALILSSLTNAIIFLPVAFLEGGDSFTDLLKAFQLPIMASLVASLFVSLIVLPLCFLFSEKFRKNQNRNNIPKSRSEPKLSYFAKALGQLYRFRRQGAALVLLLTMISFNWIRDIEATDLESPRDPFTQINFKFSADTTKFERGQFFNSVEKKVLNLATKEKRIKFIVSEQNTNYESASIVVFPVESDDKDRTLVEIDILMTKFIQENDPHQVGCMVAVGWIAAGMSSATRQYDYIMSGPRSSVIMANISELKKKLVKIPGVIDVLSDAEISGGKKLLLSVNDEKLTRMGLTTSALASQISSLSFSQSLAPVFDHEDILSVLFQLDPDEVLSLDHFKRIGILVNDKRIPAGELGEFRSLPVPASVSRAEGLNNARLRVIFDPHTPEADYQTANKNVKAVISEHILPPGYGPPKNDSAARIEEMQSKTYFIIALSLFLIYLTLGATLNSAILPFAIIFTAPIALIFGVLGLKLCGMSLDVMARLALVILVGSGVNNAIIFMDLILDLRNQGFSKKEAIIKGLTKRASAVFMTTMIQIIGVLPVALGKAKMMGIPYSSLGIVIIFGMLFSTIVTLVVLPFAYDLCDQIEQKITAS